jgi:hypothetical protein
VALPIESGASGHAVGPDGAGKVLQSVWERAALFGSSDTIQQAAADPFSQSERTGLDHLSAADILLSNDRARLFGKFPNAE